jgi:4-hydroxy-tetrahydrodipicolinate synthase
MPVSPPFTGVGVALVTLFDDDGRLLVPQTIEHAADLVDRGVRAVVLAGSTGEAWHLTVDERVELCRAAREALGTRVPLILGTGSADRAEAVRLTVAAREAGADAALALSPAGEDDPRPYYEALAEAAGDMPLLGYHFPAVSPPGIPVEALPDLPIAGCKDSSGEAERLLLELHSWDGPLYVGSSAYLPLAGALGATGAILALANTDPEGCIAAFGGDLQAQRELVDAHIEGHADFPAGLKRRLARLKGTPAAVRAGVPAATG